MLIGVFLLIVASGRLRCSGLVLQERCRSEPWTSSAVTCSRSSPTRRSWARWCCCCRPSGATTTRCAGWPTASALLGFLVSLPLWFCFDRGAAGFQFVETASWIPLDRRRSTSSASTASRALLILLTTLLGEIAILSSWTAITERVRQYYVFLLLLQTGMLGRLLRARHVPVLRVLGGDAGPDVLPDRDLGRRAPAVRGDQVLPVHAGRLGGDAARASWRSTSTRARCPSSRQTGTLRRHAAGTRWASRPTCSSGCSWPSSWASRSRCRCSRSTPGCPTRTSRRRPPAR